MWLELSALIYIFCNHDCLERRVFRCEVALYVSMWSLLVYCGRDLVLFFDVIVIILSCSLFFGKAAESTTRNCLCPLFFALTALFRFKFKLLWERSYKPRNGTTDIIMPTLVFRIVSLSTYSYKYMYNEQSLRFLCFSCNERVCGSV